VVSRPKRGYIGGAGARYTIRYVVDDQSRPALEPFDRSDTSSTFSVARRGSIHPRVKGQNGVGRE
jgi:hypothetical protein